MEPTEQGVQWLVAGEPSGVASDVDDASVAAPGQYHQPFAAHVEN
jgi:hypothetical protein